MNWILRIGWTLLKQYLMGRAVQKAKRRGVIAYIQALDGIRRALIFAFIGFLFLQTIMLAGVGALVSGVMLLDYDLHFKLQILFATFLAIFLIPILLISIALSQRVWYRVSGAEKMVNETLTEDKSTRHAA